MSNTIGPKTPTIDTRAAQAPDDDFEWVDEEVAAPEQKSGCPITAIKKAIGLAKTDNLRPNAEKISCPFLSTAYNQGQINPDPSGVIDVKQIDDLMMRFGFDEKCAQFFSKAPDQDDGPLDGKFNLFGMRDTAMNHTGSTGARDRKVDPERLEALLQFSENGRMNKDNFAKAANAFASNSFGQGGLAKGTFLETIEFTTVLQVFGRTDEKGQRYLTNQDIIGLWLENKFPEGWTPPPANSLTLGKVFGDTGGLGIKRMWQAFTGLFSSNAPAR